MRSKLISAKILPKNEVAADLCLDLVCLLPFVGVLGLRRGSFVQLVLILIAATTAATRLIYKKNRKLNFPKLAKYLLSVYGVFIFISLVIYRNANSWFGYFHDKIDSTGSLALLAIICVALMLYSVNQTRIIKYLYISIIGLSISGLVQQIESHSLIRIGGLLHQPDLLSIYMALGLILGTILYVKLPKYKYYIIAGQILLLAVLVLTQTRATLILTLLIFALIILRSRLRLNLKIIYLALLITCSALIFIFSSTIVSSRLSSVSYATSSIKYRGDLQAYALNESASSPIYGYGGGNLKSALPCSRVKSLDLMQTCSQGYYFSSSHNIFLDRILQYGWIGGLSYLGFIAYSLYLGLWSKGVTRYFAYCALLISVYYLTNVTSLGVEALLWLFLLQLYKPNIALLKKPL